MKLAAPQRDLLHDIYAGRCTVVNDDYRPARRLVQQGLIRLKERRLGAPKPVLTTEGEALAKELFGERTSA